MSPITSILYYDGGIVSLVDVGAREEQVRPLVGLGSMASRVGAVLPAVRLAFAGAAPCMNNRLGPKWVPRPKSVPSKKLKMM